MSRKRVASLLGSTFVLAIEIFANKVWDFVPIDKIKNWKDLFKYNAFYVFIVTIVLLILANLFVEHNKDVKTSNKTRKNEWEKVLKESGVYDVAAEEVKICLREHDYDGCKKIKKMIQYMIK